MELTKKLDEKALPYFKQKGRIAGFLLTALAVVTASVYFHFEMDWNILLLILILIGLVGMSIYYVWIKPVRMYRNFAYEAWENRLDIQSGVFIHSRVMIPMFRIQHVQTEQGPLLKKYGLSKITVFTAGSIYIIPALNEEVAKDLREALAIHVKGIDE